MLEQFQICGPQVSFKRLNETISMHDMGYDLYLVTGKARAA
jgi:hypothetical protein